MIKLKWYVDGNYHIIKAFRREKTLKGQMIGTAWYSDETVKSWIRKNMKKQKCLFINLSGDFIGLMTTVNYISSQKLTL